jgi:hypothetical protein
MYGVELQVSGNVFDRVDGQEGIGERELAWRRDGWKVALEGDETSTPDATADLEFVTSPCASPAELQTAVANAKLLAEEILKYAREHGRETPDGLFVDFTPGKDFLGGRWKKACTVRITDQEFHAQMQVTVGIPLHSLAPFIDTFLTRTDPNSGEQYSDLDLVRRSLAEFEKKRPKPSDELRGFIAACALFIIRGVPQYDRYVFGEKRMLHRLDAVFDFSDSDYIKRYGAPQQNPFKRDERYPIVIDKDSPKSLFGLLPRTDFHSMFRALPADDRTFLEHAVPAELWPLVADFNGVRLFPFPYRADPEATDVEARGFGAEVSTRVPVKVGPGAASELWRTILHGPTLPEWWSSVLSGDHNRQVSGVDGVKTNLPKDMASPPPGFRGRAAARLHEFPGDDEDKKYYYGMGAFPIDRDGPTPLAVFELRDFMSDQGLEGKEPTPAGWLGAVNLFIEKYLGTFRAQ